jgi:hypothetical protein
MGKEVVTWVNNLFCNFQLLLCGFFLCYIMSSKNDSNFAVERKKRGSENCLFPEKDLF